ncbi:response regulator [Legionella rowbothamii]|uniref:response regulator n=1 Tax=Legionella rowbothamii TaxID=96229 RepID=UPI001055987C|nr:response regulator [Legionella rowbothamii]
MDTNKNILIVDDFATMRKLLLSMLTKLGFTNVTEAESASKAWELLQKEHFDLVISDYNMPEMNGIELLSYVRKDSALSKLPFILLTAENDTDLVIESKKYHINAYILKPYKIDVIKEKLQTIFPA